MVEDWYEEFDFDHNPFETDPIKDQKRELFEREEEAKEVIYRIQSSSMLFIEGSAGTGKTSLLKHAIDNFRGKGKVIYVDASKIHKQLNIEKLLIDAQKFRGKVLGKYPKDMILLLDNVQELTLHNCERIKFFYDQNYVRSVVFTGENFEQNNFTPSLRNRIGSRIIRLKPLSVQSALEMLYQRLDGENLIEEDAIKEIYNNSEKNLNVFLKNCDVVVQKTFTRPPASLAKVKQIIKRPATQKIVLQSGGQMLEAVACAECNGELVKVGDYYRCPECEMYCNNCGALVDEYDFECPECLAEFDN